MVAYIRKHSTPYGPGTKRPEPDEPKPAAVGRTRSKIGYFPGCSIQAQSPEFIPLTLSILDTLGTHPILITQPCCGLPVLNAGYAEEARAMLLEFIEELRRRKIRKVITSCSGCAVMLKKHLTELTGTKIPVVHITEFLAGNEKKIRSVYGNAGKGHVVLYHDPCDLARKQDIVEEPRTVIRALGYRIAEFSRHGRETACCGGGGGFSRGYPDQSSENARERIAEASRIGIPKIVSACMSCRHQFRSVRTEGIEIVDIIELFP